MNEAELIIGLSDLVLEEWGVAGRAPGPVGGPLGMGSVVAEVDLPGVGLFVAKWVPTHAAAALDAGSAIALELDGIGLSTGAPRPTRTGLLSAPLADGRVALLRHVPGCPMSGVGEDEQQRMAAVLVAVHTARPLRQSREPYLAASLRQARDVEDWVLPAVTAVLEEYARLPALTWGLVHHDPAPEAFFHDPTTDETSLIDWTGCGEGPVLFDVASALMYLGGPDVGRPFLQAYLDLAPDVLRGEVAAHLPSLWRFRGAVQAAYFSIRVADADLTGLHDPSENLKGLQHARGMLLDAGLLERAAQTSSLSSGGGRGQPRGR